MKKSGLFFLLVLSAPAFCSTLKPFPPSPTSYVYNENVISPQAAASLSQTLSVFEQTTHRQFVVALFQGLDGEDVDDYSNRLFHAWEIGSAQKNDGLLFCVFKQDHKWRVEVGYGLEAVLTDLEASEIVRQWAVPYFRQDNFDQGVLAAVSTLTQKLSLNDGSSNHNSRQRKSGIPLRLMIDVLAIAIWLWLQSRRSTTMGRRYRGSGGYSNGGMIGGIF